MQKFIKLDNGGLKGQFAESFFYIPMFSVLNFKELQKLKSLSLISHKKGPFSYFNRIVFVDFYEDMP